jgi:hypothetical protein
MPFFTPSVSTETDADFTFLTQQCTQLKLTALGLSDEQASSTPTASSASIKGLIAHVAQVINGWLRQVEDPDRMVRFEEFGAINAEIGLEGLFDSSALPDIDIAEVVAIFERVIDGIDEVRQTVIDTGVDLGAVTATPPNQWMPQDFVMSVRWILMHLNTEVARHAGHADIIRESIDGKIAYQLNAEADGEQWPPEGMDDWS